MPGCCICSQMEIKMNYADIKPYDVANGIGIRVSLFVSGCTHHCKECFNKETWDFNYGKPFTRKEEEEIIRYLEPDYIAGLSLLGGEPMEPRNQEGILPLLRQVREKYPKKTIWCYTGYLFDKDIMEKMYPSSEITKEIISYLDILVDGEFINERKNLQINFRGSDNQRIIDVKESLRTGEVIHWKGEKV